MKYLERLLRYVFWVVVTASIAWLVKKAFKHVEAQRAEAEHQRVQARVPERRKSLVRDPVCGMYVAEDVSYLLTHGDEDLHFCSRDCMERFQRDHHSLDDRATGRLAAGA